MRQRLTMAVTAILVICGLLAFLRWNKDRDFKPLYSSLSAEDSGAVIAKLREGGIEYRVRDSDSTILVPSERIAELRLQMATAGIPKSGRIGYELFDKTNLGITDFTEQVNFHRAVEGELERSVMSMAEVEQARVHITFPKDSVFSEDRQPAKASVMVKLKPGAKMSEQNVQAVAQLASSAVEGLTPEAVAVMDMRGNLLMRARKPGDGSEASDELLQYKDKLERETLAKINSELDPLLGSEKYRAGVYIDCDLTSGEQSEESFDPSHSVITSSQRSEEGSLSTSAAAGGVPGTQSNLPRPPVKPAGVGGGIARRTENMSYETSRTVRRMKLPAGIVRRMSVSVLLDQNVRWEMTGKGASAHPQRFIDPPSAERIKAIEAIVSAAAGINTGRGDQLTVETLPFESTLNAEPPSNMLPPAPIKKTAPPRFKFSPVVAASVAVAVLLLVLVALVMKRGKQQTNAKLAQMRAQLRETEAAAVARAKELQEQLEQERNERANQESAAQQPKLHPNREPFQLAPPMTTKSEILTKHISSEATRDPAALSKIIRSWLNEPTA